MSSTDQHIPRLTPEELANPHTGISINGVEMQVWQVAHIYGVAHAMPSTMPRSGASARDFRALYPRQRDGRTAPLSALANDAIGVVTENQLLPSSLAPAPLTISARNGQQHREEDKADRDTLGIQDILGLIDELAEESWSDGSDWSDGLDDFDLFKHPNQNTVDGIRGSWQLNEAERIQRAHATSTPAAPGSRRASPLWAEPSYPPPMYPPPNRPLPPLPPPPQQPATARTSGSEPREAVVEPACPTPSRLTEEWPEQAAVDDDADSESERTITPATSRQQLVAKPRARRGPAPTTHSIVEWLAPVQSHAKEGAAQHVTAVPETREVPNPTQHAGLGRSTPIYAMGRASKQNAVVLQAQVVSVSRAPAVGQPVGQATQPVASAGRRREVSMPMPRRAAGERQPDPAHGTGGRAASASIVRDHVTGGGHRRQGDTEEATEPWPKLPANLLPHPLPSFLQTPPSFLQHPPEFLQHPYQDRQGGAATGGGSRLGRSRASSKAGTTAPSRPVTPTEDDDIAATTSRWSPESSPEESTFKKVKRVLSFAKLRSRKSSVFQRQHSDSQANEPSASVGKRSSDSSGPSGPRTSGSRAN